MRALFIIHCQDPIYGASRSVSALIRGLDADVDIIFPVKVKQEGRITPEQIKKYYGERVRNVWYLPQPARLTIQAEAIPWSDQFKSVIKELLFFLVKHQYKKIFDQGNYDFVHLNSVILYPMLDEKYPMFLHVREIVGKQKGLWNYRFSHYMRKAHGILFIGPSGKRACQNFGVPEMVLANPFDQTSVSEVDAQAVNRELGLQGTEIVYAIIGNIISEKGILFVIDAFQKANLKNAVLLIVGQDTHHRAYERDVWEKSKADCRIRCIGEIENMASIYRITDYVVRGDIEAGCGRTTYESLYSGGGAIVQYQLESDCLLPGITEEMKQNIEFYRLRNEDDLIRAFQKTQFKKIEKRHYHSNVQEYVDCFLQFIENNI